MRSFVTIAAVALALEGCSLPYLKTTQESYRVDPVLVQYTKIGSGGSCFNPNKDKADQRDKLAETLCPLDLDTYRFPADEQRASGKEGAANSVPTAYTILQECQKSAAATRFLADSLSARKAAEASRDAASTSAERAYRKVRDQDAAIEMINRGMAADDLAIKPLAAKKSPSAAEAKKLAEIRAHRKGLEAERGNAIAERQKLAAAADAAGAAAAESDAAFRRASRGYSDTQTQVVKAPDGTVDPETCRVLRNFLQDELITRSQQMCKKHLADITATSALLNADLGFLSLVSSTLGAVVGGVQAKTNLSGLSAGSLATQTLLNKEIYRDIVVPAITKKIEGDRSNKMSEILADQTKDVSAYSVSRSIVDANDYHERCSFAHGLLLLASDSEKRTPPRIEEFEAQITKNYAQIAAAQSSLSTNSTDQEKDIVQKTVERLQQDNQALLIRMNLLKRIQSPN